MAIPNKYIDKIKDKDSGESRPICPPAEHVQVDNENFEGETLDEVLDEVAQAIEDAGQGGYAPPAGGIPKSDLAQSVQDSLDKADSALQDEDVAEVAKTGDYDDLQNKPTIPDTSNLATKTELATKQDALVAGNGIVIANDGKTVSVDAEVVQPVTADGTFSIRIGNNTYTINLNHTHENMAKIVKCTEATLPQTLDNDTIYVQVDNATTPSEIESLWLFGLEFTGGGVAPGTPRLIRPTDGGTINLGETVSGSVRKTINIKANKYLTMPLVVALSNSSTGYAFDTTNLPTGVTYDSNTGKLTVAADAARSLDGVDIVVVYTDTPTNVDGVLGITSASPDNITVEVSLVAAHGLPSGYTKCEYIYYNSNQSGNSNPYIDTGAIATSNTRVVAKMQWGVATGSWEWPWGARSMDNSYKFECMATPTSNVSFIITGSQFPSGYKTEDTSPKEFDVDKDRLIFNGIEYDSTTSGSAFTTNVSIVIGALNGETPGGSLKNVKIWYFKIYESGTLVRDFMPAYNSSLQKYGLYDFVTGTFYSSVRSGKEFSGVIIS